MTTIRAGLVLRRRPRGEVNRHSLTALSLLLPAAIFFIGLYFVPIAYQLVDSLFTGAHSDVFVGLDNFVRAVQDPAVLSSFTTTLVFAIGSLVIGCGLGLLLALMLNQALPGKSIFRAVMLIPYLTSVAIIGLLWRNILDPYVGILNRVLSIFGIPGQTWLTTAPLGVIIGLAVWSSLGYTMVLFLAGLQGIPAEYYEAARIDGASQFRQFWSITLPLLAPTTLFVTVIGVIGSLQQFALPYIVTNGGPGDATSLFAFKVFSVAFSDSDFGYASALAFILLIVILVLSLAQFRIAKRWE